MLNFKHKQCHELDMDAERLHRMGGGKVGKVCSEVTSSSPVLSGCGKTHTNLYVWCATGLVYEGQTKFCMNVRAHEVERSLEDYSTTFLNLPASCRSCTKNCGPLLNRIKILTRSRDRLARELSEAFFIDQRGGTCMNTTSVSPHASEIRLFKRGILGTLSALTNAHVLRFSTVF